MIPDLRHIASAAERVLDAVPEGVAGGSDPVGLYGLGFLGRWVLPKLKAEGVRLVSCFDNNPALKGSLAEGLPVYAADDLALVQPKFVIISARHAVKSVSGKIG